MVAAQTTPTMTVLPMKPDHPSPHPRAWRLVTGIFTLSSACLSMTAHAETSMTATPAQAGHLRLVDPLDRPQDGYCLDILGSGPHIRFDMPMTAHNCKPGLYADEAVAWDRDGKIRFPAYDVCATVAGIQKTVLAGAAVMPRACDERSPFLEAQHLQHFIHRPDGRVELAGSGLCLSAGVESARTFAPDHRWRVLSMQRCQDVPLSHSRWRLVIPGS